SVIMRTRGVVPRFGPDPYGPLRGGTHAEPGRERATHQGGRGNADGDVAPPVLVSHRGLRPARRQSGQRREAPGGAAGAVPRREGPARTDRGAVSPPARLAALRHSGRGRAAVLLPRLDVRRERTLPGDARGASREHVQGPRANDGLSRGGAGRVDFR